MVIKRAWKKVNSIVQKKLITPLKVKHYLSNIDSLSLGSDKWLLASEIKYGGYVTKVPRVKVSPQDPRPQQEVESGGVTGGDRMLHHGYAKEYSEYLKPFLGDPVVLMEIGILKGTGLAIWCDLFKSGRIVGLDIDLGHTKNNIENIKKLGGFSCNSPELHEFDQFLDNEKYLGGLLGGDLVDIVIDDGFHSIESIMCTMKSVMPCLKQNFVYIVEDNSEVHIEIAKHYPEFETASFGELTIVTRTKK